MEKLYVNEIREDGEVSNVGLFYSFSEAEKVVSQLQSVPEKASCRYEIVQAFTGLASTNPPKSTGISIREG
ncbi:MAG TPA: hypothetical protein VFU31_04495 [Candidatus Binatia bacterium]|nr:hypothetical protein [Candidatus Binatia bacterium]